ncbi:MAG: flagellar brake protein [Gammaproteobacteria bacterium]|nr:flagellar brake protein [Gammaproteobacteria bacterium]
MKNCDMTDSVNIEHITQPEIMSGYLYRLQRAHTLLSVHIPGIDRSYNSIIIDVDADKNQMMLDVLHPESGHKEVMKLKEFSVNAHHEGIKLSFNGYIKELFNDDGKPAYLIDYPASLDYHQQREAYRAPVSMGDNVEIKINNESNMLSQGLITDISLGGLGLQFELKNSMPFRSGMLLPTCQFAIPGKNDFECALEVRNVREDSNNRFVYIGARYVKLGRQEERQIQQFVVKLERNMIRRSQR